VSGRRAVFPSVEGAASSRRWCEIVSRFFQRFVFVLSVAIFACPRPRLRSSFGEFGLFGVHAGSRLRWRLPPDARLRRSPQEGPDRLRHRPNINDVTTGALHGLLESLDSDSSYLTPTEYKIYKDRPTTGVAQVGIVTSKRFGYATIVSVLPGSPADHEHLSDGDVIESIGDQSTRELSLAVIRLMLEGKPGPPSISPSSAPARPTPTSSPSPAPSPPHPARRAAIRELHHPLPQARPAHRRPASTKSPPSSNPKAKTAKSFSTSATPPATTPSRASAWPTSSSSREPSPPSRARSSPPRPSPPIRPCSSPMPPRCARQPRHLRRG
jgi:hypothetical protein